jgi:hypothetical protein
MPPSPALLAAQERLLALREKSQAQRAALGLIPVDNALVDDTVEDGRLASEQQLSAILEPQASANLILPTHLGWGSEPLTAILRRLQVEKQASETKDQMSILVDSGSEWPIEPVVEYAVSEPQAATPVSVRIYPDVALGILRQEQTAPARIWYLLRHLDEAGQGWLEETAVRHHLTRRESALRLCGQRQLRNLLDQGEGLFWERRNGRLWLRSLVKVAAALGVTRLQGHPVAVPLPHFTAGIGTFRAHLYATFHSGRGSQEKAAGPIARETVAALSHVPARTQRLYEEVAGVEKETNFALGQPIEPKATQEAGWQKGQALFCFTDYQGKQGPAGKTYLAWQLPNSYTGPHQQQKNGRQKRLNQAIADLLQIGMTGNGDGLTEPQRQRRYCHHGKMAARLYNRSAHDVYWPSPEGRLWYGLNGKMNE